MYEATRQGQATLDQGQESKMSASTQSTSCTQTETAMVRVDPNQSLHPELNYRITGQWHNICMILAGHILGNIYVIVQHSLTNPRLCLPSPSHYYQSSESLIVTFLLPSPLCCFLVCPFKLLSILLRIIDSEVLTFIYTQVAFERAREHPGNGQFGGEFGGEFGWGVRGRPRDAAACELELESLWIRHAARERSIGFGWLFDHGSGACGG